MSTTNGIPIYKLIGTYTFPEINANNAQLPTFYSRRLDLNKQVGKPLENKISFGDTVYNCSTVDRGTDYIIPIYDFSSAMANVSLSFIQPSGFKLLQVYTPNGELDKNNLFFVFTTNNNAFIDDTYPVFDAYDTIASDMVNNSSTGLFNTSLTTTETADRRLNEMPNTFENRFAADRLMLNGVNKGPVANVT